ncbi:alpha/beta hydrolase [Streptomyces sp. MC1]|uniref:alpha/beta hydrolase n=1 Tax=Streptomyces sp. MC1 TaxID=295105 RepID=UPI0027DEA63B|nr:alpha/beta hydrolase [Streptomyces sp. MC1]
MPARTPLPPTVVLVHGAFTDASSWSGVIRRLHAAGLTVHAPANPLRGLAHDAAYLRSVVRQIGTPVVLAGHGYGGAVITCADSDDVVALCYVAGFGLDAGECLLDVTNRFSPMPGPDPTVAAGVPGRSPANPDSELYIRRERFRDVYAADLAPRVGSVLSVTQRPIARDALTAASGPPAWARKRSWYAIAAADRMLNPTAQRFMAQRMAATERVMDGSHAVVLSRPDAVAAMIREAAGQCGDHGYRY